MSEGGGKMGMVLAGRKGVVENTLSLLVSFGLLRTAHCMWRQTPRKQHGY